MHNNSKCIVKRWSIDKIVFKERKEERCDFLLLVENPNKWRYYWIELKGKDVVKACRQILSTMALIHVVKIATHDARIVTTGTNKIAVRRIEYLKLDITVRKTGGRLKCFTNKGSEKI